MHKNECCEQRFTGAGIFFSFPGEQWLHARQFSVHGDPAEKCQPTALRPPVKRPTGKEGSLLRCGNTRADPKPQTGQ